VAQEDPKQVTAELWMALESLRSERICLASRALFRNGETSRGVYLVEEGEVQLLLSSAGGRERLLETVGPGTILGLSEAMSGEAHKLTAQAAGRTQVSFVRRPDLINFLRKNPALCMQLVHLLSENLHSLYHLFVMESVSASRPRSKGRESTPGIGIRRVN
jgi:CRP/FNR family transcriptional regulator, dissimilatory nitrate respiration regulator